MSAQSVSAAVVRPLRTLILRPGWTDRLATYPEDDNSKTRHIAFLRNDEVVGVATVYPEPPPAMHLGSIPDAAFAHGSAFRLRGMATSPAVRGTGVGRAVLDGCFEQIRASGGAFLWCNARVVALPFYVRMGIETVGDEFDIPEIGPHYVMWCRI